MATYVFELKGCNSANLAAVKAALATIPGLSFNIEVSARGTFVVFIESDLSESAIIDLVNSALAYLGISVATVPKPSGPKI